MANSVIMSMESKTSYKKNAFVIAMVSLAFLIPGIIMMYVLFIEQKRYYNMVHVVAFTMALVSIGGDLLVIAAGYLVKHSKARSTYLTISTDYISGQINGKEFQIENDSLISTSIQKCSVSVTVDGVPTDLNPGFMKKLRNDTNDYLCIFTTTGKTYYIDSLLSLNTAKNTIDAIIMNKALNK